MARIGRITVPGLPHHVTQRGNRNQPIFFERGDYVVYLRFLGAQCRRAVVDVWAYCLVPGQVHLILVPHSADGLARAIGETHRKYTAFVNARAGCTGHLFHDRFASVAMDGEHLRHAVAHVAQSPVRAGLAARPQDWPWSSAYVAGGRGELICVPPLVKRVDGLTDLAADEPDPAAVARLRAAERMGRPVGSEEFLSRIEQVLHRPVRPQKPGRKPKPERDDRDRGNEPGMQAAVTRIQRVA